MKRPIAVATVLILALTALLILLETGGAFGGPDSPDSCPNRDLYHVIDLGTLEGYDEPFPFDINERGQVVGYSILDNSENTSSFIWQDGTMSQIIVPSGPDFFATSINNHGQVAGHVFSETVSGTIQLTLHVPAVLYENQVDILEPLDGLNGIAWDINDNGKAAGKSSSEFFNTNDHAVLWNGFTPTDLGTLGGYTSYAYGINESGIVVGMADDEEYRKRDAFIYKNQQMVGLGSLGGTTSVAYDINDLNQVVGNSWISNGTDHAVLWENGQIVDLGQTVTNVGLDPYSTDSGAWKINNQGMVVGYFFGPSGRQAALWQNGTLIDLNNCVENKAPFSEFKEARAINNQGWIVGQGRVKGGDHAFLLTTPRTLFLPYVTIQ